jgi:LysR family transcriptional regulator, transcriptional activator of nhaA
MYHLTMRQLNYHHLLYFWMVVREGGVARAGVRLRLAQPTISGQIRALEDAFGEKLFERVGRRLKPTEMGRVVYRYADQIFTLGRELEDTLAGRSPARALRLQIGVANVVPKLVTCRILESVFRLPTPVRVAVHVDRHERLLAELAVQELDLVLSDSTVGPGVNVRAFNHTLGECGVTIFAAPKIARKYRAGFPHSLDGAPFLLPTEAAAIRREIDQWFESKRIQPRVAGEFNDSAMVDAFGQAGLGLFTAPSAIESQVRQQYGVQIVGRIQGIRQHYYAISIQRRLKHPAVIALIETARRTLFK